MKNVKIILVMILALTMILCLCACGEDAPEQTDPSQTTAATEPSETEPSATEPSETEPSETNPTETEPSETAPTAPAAYDYSITVRDVDGNPFADLLVQLCLGDSGCLPGMTDANGAAYFYDGVLTGEGELVAKISMIPDGYQVVGGVTQITLTDDLTDVVFVLEPVEAES